MEIRDLRLMEQGDIMKFFVRLILAIGFAGALNAAGTQGQSAAGQQRQNNAPIYQVRVVGNSVTAISYQHRSGSTEIGFQGTPLLAQAKGQG
ncbi:MAG: hypothetical protein WBC04_14620, partial [Candidatus Acidiferrales bacterium]